MSVDLILAAFPDELLPFAAHDGSQGVNRAVAGRSQLAATTDIQAINAWLARFSGSKNTFDNYRKEVERLVLWSTMSRQKPVSSLTHEDLLAYQHFLADPQPSARWVMRPGRKVARAHPDWRPFAGPLALASQRQALIILNSMFSWLVSAGYLAGNPLALSRQRTRRNAARITRYLSEEVWLDVKTAIEEMPQASGREREHYLRVRWLFTLLYLCGLRISEVTQNTMGGFFCRRDARGAERWWLEVTGKGDKKRIIPATTELMAELVRYRQQKGLPPFPAPAEATPLVAPLGHQQRPLTRAALHTIVKSVFKLAADRVRKRDPDLEWKAQNLEHASAHWLRHTAGSHMANKQIDLRHVRDTLGHESLSTTNTYLHSTDDARHQETEQHHKIDW
ncbi:MAG: tyrosine-type recombinase/integrase [Pusillimonas sp.]